MQNGLDSVLDSVLESGHKAVDFPFPTSCEVFRKNSKPPYRVFLVANQSHRNEHLVGSGYEDISQVEVAFTLLSSAARSKREENHVNMAKTHQPAKSRSCDWHIRAFEPPQATSGKSTKILLLQLS